MAVMIGSARGDENGGAYGGKAGDQTGREVSTQTWYRHSKGWRVFRCRDEAKARRIAQAMRAACANDRIGYDQYQRLTLYNAAAVHGFDPSLVTEPVETDCSALVRVCLAYAGITTSNFNTTIQPQILLGTGEFIELTGSKYTDSSDYLRAGDVLVTPVQGHTVVVLDDGPKAGADTAEAIPPRYMLGQRTLRHGMTGEDVQDLQASLISLGYDCGSWGADGDFGDATELAVYAFQQASGLTVDGVFGTKSLAALNDALAAAEAAKTAGRTVAIFGGSCWVRAANSTGAAKLGAVTAGTKLPYQGVTAENGWLLVEYRNQNGWVSGKYGRVE